MRTGESGASSLVRELGEDGQLFLKNLLKQFVKQHYYTNTGFNHTEIETNTEKRCFILKLKVTIMGSDWGYYAIEDYSDFYEDVKQDKGKVGADKYFAAGDYSDEWIEQNMHEHFLFSWLENLMQSDDCPFELFNQRDDYMCKVEWL